MSYEHCDKHDVDATNGCRKCIEADYGVAYQKRIDEGAEGVDCGLCGREVDEGFVPEDGSEDEDTKAFLIEHGLCLDCAYRASQFVLAWRGAR
jgi:hypothetical protein